MTTLFVSDVHLSPLAPERTERFVSFLRSRVIEEGADIVVVGDLFDWWYGGRGPLPPDVRQIVDLLEQANSALWMEGNHDVLIGRAFDGPCAIASAEGPLDLTLGGRALHVAHGDLVDESDVGYLLFRKLLRGVPGRLAATLAGRRVTRAVGSFAARRSRQAQGGADGYDGLSARWLAAAQRYAAARRAAGASLTILGHGHWLGWWPEGLICLGDWFVHDSYLRVVDGTVSLHAFHPDGDVLLRSGPEGAVARPG